MPRIRPLDPSRSTAVTDRDRASDSARGAAAPKKAPIPDLSPSERARSAKLLGDVPTRRERLGSLTYRVYPGITGVSPKKLVLGAVIADGKLLGLRAAAQTGATSQRGPSKLFEHDGVRYARLSGQPVKLGHGAVIEGSVETGGIQPHYVIDTNHPSLKELLTQARALAGEKLDFWERVDHVVALVRQTLRRKAYRSPPYLRLLKEARTHNANVSLGDYVASACGVCREHALLTHLALLEAGVDCRYMYARATQGDLSEDHAVVLVRHGGETWVVDAYNRNFHGARIQDLLEPGGSSPSAPHLPSADPIEYGCTLRVNDYPTYWLPVGEVKKQR